MNVSGSFHPLSPERGNWVRLRTLINLRWLAISGQTLALLVATQVLGLQIRLDLCGLLIGMSAAFNIGATLIHPENKRLSHRDAMLTLLFDVAQLGLLLYLTGGLSNPFAMLILAQTIIAATILTLRSTILLALVSLSVIAALASFHVPLRMQNGALLEVSDLLVFGTWAALSISVVFIGFYARSVSQESYSMSEALSATQLALEQEHKLTALGGVVAAAAHELGTPLATIKLASSELLDDLSDRPDLKADAELIKRQAERCGEILSSMGQRGKDDLHLQRAPFSAVVEEAAGPHMRRGKQVLIRPMGRTGSQTLLDQPEISRRAEIIHGVRNLIQNAVDFAASTVWIDLDWTEEKLMLRVRDDGKGFPNHLLGRIGDPFVSRRNRPSDTRTDRPGYKGMGLGLFIAKTLLERTGADLTFANGASSATPAASGAIVEVVWSRSDLAIPREESRGALGENKKLFPDSGVELTEN